MSPFPPNVRERSCGGREGEGTRCFLSGRDHGGDIGSISAESIFLPALTRQALNIRKSGQGSTAGTWSREPAFPEHMAHDTSWTTSLVSELSGWGACLAAHGKCPSPLTGAPGSRDCRCVSAWCGSVGLAGMEDAQSTSIRTADCPRSPSRAASQG